MNYKTEPSRLCGYCSSRDVMSSFCKSGFLQATEGRCHDNAPCLIKKDRKIVTWKEYENEC